MKPTEILMAEHRVIEVLLNCLEKIAGEATQAGKLDETSATGAIEVIQIFADKCHHAKEENHLFEAMVAKGMPKEGGPVGQMLIEHDQSREYVAGMAGSVTAAATGDTDAVEKFTQNALGYVHLLRAHIQKEDEVLYVMANRFLTEEDQAQLLESFAAVENDPAQKDAHEKQIATVLSLAQKYEVSADAVNGLSCGCNHK